ncbi:MAG: DUF4062 domain-containing protein [Vicinamibacterales bacterium]|jgi:hypothetical protein
MRNRTEAEQEPLLIDRAAAAEIPSQDSVREWAHGRRAFISSVMSELPDERRGAADAVRALGGTPVTFEQFGGRDADPEDAYLAEVETSDIYVGILGRSYGKPLPSRFSATHSEYLHAEKCGLRIATWCLKANDREGHEESFLNEVRTFHVVPDFVTPDDLRLQVEDRLKAIAAEDLAPWCKLGNIVFRATEVGDDGNRLRVVARVRSDDVAHALEAMRSGNINRGGEGRFTWSGRSRLVRVSSVDTTTTSSRSRIVRLQLEGREGGHDPMLEVSVSGHTADELTEAGLRTALFGTRHPLAGQHLGFIGEIADPFAALRAARVSDEITRPLAELMLVDALVGSGRATRISQFKLGTAVRGIRRLVVGWQPPRRYSNARASERLVEGDVRL